MHGTRQIPVIAGEGLRLLRCRAGLGQQRSAVRQRQSDGLAYCLSRRRGAAAPETTGLLPFENDLRLVLSEFADAHEGICPRGTPRRVLKRAKDMGYDVRSAV